MIELEGVMALGLSLLLSCHWGTYFFYARALNLLRLALGLRLLPPLFLFEPSWIRVVLPSALILECWLRIQLTILLNRHSWLKCLYGLGWAVCLSCDWGLISFLVLYHRIIISNRIDHSGVFVKFIHLLNGNVCVLGSSRDR